MIKLLEILKESIYDDLIKVAESIKGDRVIGSYETFGESFIFNKKDVSDIANKFNLKFKILKFPEYPKESEGIVFYKNVPNIDYVVNIYLKYQRNGGQAEKLTKKENIILGKAFGFSQEEIQYFIKDVYSINKEDEYYMSIAAKEAQHREIPVKEFINKLYKDAKKVYDESKPDPESGIMIKNYKGIWNLYPAESLLISEEDFFDLLLWIVRKQNNLDK
jgi:hypothetical protein